MGSLTSRIVLLQSQELVLFDCLQSIESSSKGVVLIWVLMRKEDFIGFVHVSNLELNGEIVRLVTFRYFCLLSWDPIVHFREEVDDSSGKELVLAVSEQE